MQNLLLLNKFLTTLCTLMERRLYKLDGRMKFYGHFTVEGWFICTYPNNGTTLDQAVVAMIQW